MAIEDHNYILQKLLAITEEKNASDLIVNCADNPAIRIYGRLEKISDIKFSNEDVRKLIGLMVSEDVLKKYVSELEIDFAYDFSDKSRFRVNAYHTIYGSSMVFRRIPKALPNIDDILAPNILKDIVAREHGLVLVTGPTGSGKSTTLAALMGYINDNYSKHIITIEDPVEFIYTSKNSVITQRQVGTSTKSFPGALRSALRQDPDVILVGEMRDPETVRLALTAAETGHLVFGTLHTNNAYQSINRILDIFPAELRKLSVSLLSSTLIAAISQRLLPSNVEVGLIPAYEVLVATTAVKNLIREEQIQQIYSMMQVGGKFGMVTLKDSITTLLQQKLVDEKVARNLLNEIGNFNQGKSN
jgi:twitching motility protein PilT